MGRMSLAVDRPARSPFQRLHEIGKVLMQFDRLEDAIPRVLRLAAGDEAIRSEVLITAAAGPKHPFVWGGVQVSAPALCDAVERARAAHERLAHPEAAPLPPEPEPGCAAFPLVGSEGDVLGTLVLEWTHPPDGEGLAFGEDVAGLLALAMDRETRVLRATRSRDDLLATVSHELKNLLAALRVNLEILDRSTALIADTAPRAPLQRAWRTAERMGWLIQDLLDVRCVEARRLTVHPRRQEAAAALNEALEAAAPLAAMRSIQLRSEVAPGLPAVLADPARLQQVFANLLANAIRFSPEGGRITLRARPCEEGVTFSVEDHGAGIAAADQPRLFDRFWQGRYSAGSGYGLGLFIVQGIVRAHGGRIWVESEVGHGATFFFTLPAAGPSTEPVPATRH
jgi:signal transduction histidine kinase